MTMRNRFLLLFIAIVGHGVATDLILKHVAKAGGPWATVCYGLLVLAIFALGRYSQRVDPDPVT